MPASTSRKWIALVLLCATQFLVVLDVAIVNVALPSIQTSLDFSQADLQWVVSAYTLTFGGLLLLGGRAADLLGRRRVFMAGLALFSLASLACGFAESDSFLIAARAVQGVGAAIISPAALSILVTTFEEGAERNKALGIWGAIAGIGGAAGVLAGGILTDGLGWEWIFFVNVPVGLLVLALVPRFIDESRAEGVTRNFDVAGAVTVTAGLSLLVYALVNTDSAGWGSAETIGLLGASAALVAAFVAIEMRAAAPLMPLGIFRLRSLTGANVVGLLLGAAIFSMFFFLSLYMQQVLGYSALRSGFAYLLVAIVIVLAAGASQALVTRLGVRTVLATGMSLLTLGLLWFTQIDVSGSYAVDLVPGFLLTGVGLGFSFVPVSIAALQGVRAHEAGVASGLINTSQQIGGALGIAVLSTIATSHTADVLRDAGGASQAVPGALTEGFQYAFAVGAALAVVGLLATLVSFGRRSEPQGAGATAEEGA
ncbi:MFS transporter [Miltoncostaea marina]|uniref:MFS transporter n=1 Tax=Miltoncostaea marina TaxID=2843215 RepID=UPI001C3C2FC9|nr:MFS transporter [Miltoncostaea marina]